MSPQPQVFDDQVAAIVDYVRQLQAVNGITTHPRTMQPRSCGTEPA